MFMNLSYLCHGWSEFRLDILEFLSFLLQDHQELRLARRIGIVGKLSQLELRPIE